MTKNEFIKRYGEEAHQKQLEYLKQYREQHRDEMKQYREQHREERKQYFKQYREQHLEERKQYYQQHLDEIKQYQKQYREQHLEEMKQYHKQYNREHTQMFTYCISDQIEQIENYEVAKIDNFDGWHIHHRLETHNSDGQKRLVNLSKAELIALDMYYNRPASELIFMKAGDHISLHRKGGEK